VLCYAAGVGFGGVFVEGACGGEADGEVDGVGEGMVHGWWEFVCRACSHGILAPFMSEHGLGASMLTPIKPSSVDNDVEGSSAVPSAVNGCFRFRNN